MQQPTRRQDEILALVARDKTNKEIASALAISPKTVEILLTRAYKRLSVRSRVGAVLKRYDQMQAGV